MTSDRFRRILTLALPIIGGMMSQNVLNLVDMAMVGVLGPAALAAVGVGSFASFMAVAVIMGLSSGVQAMTARRIGEGREDESAVPLNGGLFLAAVIGVPIAVVMYLLTPGFFPYLNADPAVVTDGVPYFQARVLAIVAVGMNFSFRGYWTGVSLTRLYLRTLLIMHACNVVLNYLLIYGKFGFPEYGAAGAGMGTAISTYIGTGIYIFLAWRIARPNGFFPPGARARDHGHHAAALYTVRDPAIPVRRRHDGVLLDHRPGRHGGNGRGQCHNQPPAGGYTAGHGARTCRHDARLRSARPGRRRTMRANGVMTCSRSPVLRWAFSGCRRY